VHVECQPVALDHDLDGTGKYGGALGGERLQRRRFPDAEREPGRAMVDARVRHVEGGAQHADDPVRAGLPPLARQRRVARAYRDRLPWGSDPSEVTDLLTSLDVPGMEADLGLPDVRALVFDTAEAAIGPIRALVNVHTHDPGGGIFDVDGAELDRHLAINVRGTYLLTRELVERYQPASGPGRVVNFVSGPPLIGSVAYATSKGAVHWMTLSIAGEVAARGITVNAVNPGPTDTGWMSPELRERLDRTNPIGRISTPRDAANLVRFLLSDEGGWITGQLLQSDGGFSQLATP
jgi:3-oxoacyl-[acyl-carrier protein] reductase